MFCTSTRKHSYKYMDAATPLARHGNVVYGIWTHHCKMDKAIIQSTDSYEVTTVDVIVL
jgi:hypothetical protein